METNFVKWWRRGSTGLEFGIVVVAMMSALWGRRRVEGRAAAYHGSNGDMLSIGSWRAERESVCV